MAAELVRSGLPIDIYARVSQLKRNEKREPSTDGQVKVCRVRLIDLGLAEGKVLVDPGRSAWNPAVERPAWDELMDRLERGVSGGFIVFDLERFTRQPKDGERMIALAAAGLLVLDSESEYDLRTPNGKKSFRDAINAAAYYSDRLSTRSARGKKLKAMAGEPNGSARPFGFEDDRVTQREDEAAVLRELTARFLAGELEDALIADLNARGIPTAQGKPWTHAALKTLLTRQRNCGRIIYTDPASGLTSVVGRLPGDPDRFRGGLRPGMRDVRRASAGASEFTALPVLVVRRLRAARLRPCPPRQGPQRPQAVPGWVGEPFVLVQPHCRRVRKDRSGPAGAGLSGTCARGRDPVGRAQHRAD